MGISDDLVSEIVGRVLTASNPKRIVLFGSAATGRMTRDSDIDLLITEPDPGDTRQKSVQISATLRDLGYGFDVIVMREERFQETKDVIGGIAYPANKYGKVIYEGA